MLKVEEVLAVYSGNLASMAGELADISSKMAAMSEVIGGLTTEVKGAGAAPAPEAADQPGEVPVTFVELRKLLTEKSRAGHTAEVKAILTAHGADRLSELDPAEYTAVMAEAGVLGNG